MTKNEKWRSEEVGLRSPAVQIFVFSSKPATAIVARVLF